MARKHANVYDAMLAGFMKLLLVICIGALTLSKFAGFEWCAAAGRSEDPRLPAADTDTALFLQVAHPGSPPRAHYPSEKPQASVSVV